MANIFTISIATTDLKADPSGKTSAVFTVTNILSKSVRGIAKAKAMGNTQQEWLKIEGETERDFTAGGTQQFTVNFSKPVSTPAPGTPAAPPEKFPFRLDVVSANNPDEQFTEGQTVNVEVKQPEAPPVIKPFPWWIVFVAGGALLLVGIILLLVFLLSGGSGKFSGTWVNVNPNAPPPPNLNYMITKMDIEQSGSELKVHAMNKCAPTDCDWGVSTGSVESGVGKVTIDHGIIVHKMEIREDGEGKIKASVLSTYRYGGIVNQAAEFSFTKQPSP